MRALIVVLVAAGCALGPSASQARGVGVISARSSVELVGHGVRPSPSPPRATPTARSAAGARGAMAYILLILGLSTVAGLIRLVGSVMGLDHALRAPVGQDNEPLAAAHVPLVGAE